MFSQRRFLILILLVCLFNLGFDTAFPVKNPFEWLAELENSVAGHSEEGSLTERINNLEEMVTGKVRTDSIVERLTRLNTLLFVNQPYDVCLLNKTQALEWVLYKKGFTGSLQERLQRMEQLMFGAVYSGPINKRLEKLVNQVFPNGTINGKWISVPEGLVVKVRMVNELSSSRSKPGTSFRFEVVENVYSDDFILFPAGSGGSGVLKEVNPPANLGRDAKLTLDFAEIRALDGTSVKMFYGSKALEMDRSRRLAVSASAAGMLALGPGGILFGLAIKGQEKIIPAGAEFYLQVKEPARIYTIER
ncbi:MAG: hypothetical protein ACM3X9_02795 [Bacillota bacterium]